MVEHASLAAPVTALSIEDTKMLRGVTMIR